MNSTFVSYVGRLTVERDEVQPEGITLNDIIGAHLLLAVSNGYYVVDMLTRDIGTARDVAMVARVAFHEAGVYVELKRWADSSAFARPSESIVEGGR